MFLAIGCGVVCGVGCASGVVGAFVVMLCLLSFGCSRWMGVCCWIGVSVWDVSRGVFLGGCFFCVGCL